MPELTLPARRAYTDTTVTVLKACSSSYAQRYAFTRFIEGLVYQNDVVVADAAHEVVSLTNPCIAWEIGTLISDLNQRHSKNQVQQYIGQKVFDLMMVIEPDLEALVELKYMFETV